MQLGTLCCQIVESALKILPVKVQIIQRVNAMTIHIVKLRCVLIQLTQFLLEIGTGRLIVLRFREDPQLITEIHVKITNVPCVPKRRVVFVIATWHIGSVIDYCFLAAVVCTTAYMLLPIGWCPFLVYDMGKCLPEEMNFVIANSKLQNDFDIASTHMVLVDAKLPAKSVKSMISEMEQVDGVKYVLGLESVIGSRVPQEILPDTVKSIVESDRWELLLINSEYPAASDAVNEQITQLNNILKEYDSTGMVIGEAPCLKDMIETTGHDFAVVTAVSIAAIFLIILLVEKSLTLPIILISVIELGIFINLGLPHYLGQSMAFITPICISTIQLGATVDYAILMTTRYKAERIAGNDKKTAVWTALYTSIPSIIVSGMGMFAATFGVAMYSNIEIVSSMCLLIARGSVISMLLVIFILPAMFMLMDKIICKTTLGMTKIKSGKNTMEVFDNE